MELEAARIDNSGSATARAEQFEKVCDPVLPHAVVSNAASETRTPPAATARAPDALPSANEIVITIAASPSPAAGDSVLAASANGATAVTSAGSSDSAAANARPVAAPEVNTSLNASFRHHFDDTVTACIIKYLPADQLLELCTVSKRWNRLASSQTVWCDIFRTSMHNLLGALRDLLTHKPHRLADRANRVLGGFDAAQHDTRKALGIHAVTAAGTNGVSTMYVFPTTAGARKTIHWDTSGFDVSGGDLRPDATLPADQSGRYEPRDPRVIVFNQTVDVIMPISDGDTKAATAGLSPAAADAQPDPNRAAALTAALTLRYSQLLAAGFDFATPTAADAVSPAPIIRSSISTPSDRTHTLRYPFLLGTKPQFLLFRKTLSQQFATEFADARARSDWESRAKQYAVMAEGMKQVTVDWCVRCGAIGFVLMLAFMVLLSVHGFGVDIHDSTAIADVPSTHGLSWWIVFIPLLLLGVSITSYAVMVCVAQRYTYPGVMNYRFLQRHGTELRDGYHRAVQDLKWTHAVAIGVGIGFIAFVVLCGLVSSGLLPGWSVFIPLGVIFFVLWNLSTRLMLRSRQRGVSASDYLTPICGVPPSVPGIHTAFHPFCSATFLILLWLVLAALRFAGVLTDSWIVIWTPLWILHGIATIQFATFARRAQYIGMSTCSTLRWTLILPVPQFVFQLLLVLVLDGVLRLPLVVVLIPVWFAVVTLPLALVRLRQETAHLSS